MARVFAGDRFIDVPGTSKGTLGTSGAYYNQRLATDPYFYAAMEIQNVLNGSTWWIGEHDDLTNVLGSGTQSGTGTITVTNIPAVQSPMLCTIRVRLSGYIAFETNAYLTSSGGLSYIIQVTDPTA